MLCVLGTCDFIFFTTLARFEILMCQYILVILSQETDHMWVKVAHVMRRDLLLALIRYNNEYMFTSCVYQI